MRSELKCAGWVLALSLVAGATTACEAKESAGRAEHPPDLECELRSDTAPIRERFDEFGDIASASWCGVVLNGGDSRVPGPTDVRLVGVLRPKRPGTVREMVEDDGRWGFRTATPDEIPAELSKSLPADAEWLESEVLNSRITQEAYEGSFYVDRETMTVLFDGVNPPAGD